MGAFHDLELKFDQEFSAAVDFDWIERLDPQLDCGQSAIFNVYRTKDHKLGNIDRSDAVGAQSFGKLLDHVRRKMTQLAEEWLSGNIAIRPAQHGKSIACTRCLYISVCRFEYAVRRTQTLGEMSRVQVLEQLAKEDGSDD